MNRLNVPEIAYSKKIVSLNSKSFYFTYKFNDRTGRWHLDISDQDDSVLALGLILLDEGAVTLHISKLNDAMGGYLLIVKQKDTLESCSRNNVGIDKEYELVYVSFKEANESVI